MLRIGGHWPHVWLSQQKNIPKRSENKLTVLRRNWKFIPWVYRDPIKRGCRCKILDDVSHLSGHSQFHLFAFTSNVHVIFQCKVWSDNQDWLTIQNPLFLTNIQLVNQNYSKKKKENSKVEHRYFWKWF